MPAYDTDLDRLAAELPRAPWWQWQPGMLARTRKMSGWASYAWSPERFQDGDIPDLHHAPTLKAVIDLAYFAGFQSAQPEADE